VSSEWDKIGLKVVVLPVPCPHCFHVNNVACMEWFGKIRPGTSSGDCYMCGRSVKITVQEDRTVLAEKG
jgi:transcription elongation factor Elf1